MKILKLKIELPKCILKYHNCHVWVWLERGQAILVEIGTVMRSLWVNWKSLTHLGVLGSQSD